MKYLTQSRDPSMMHQQANATSLPTSSAAQLEHWSYGSLFAHLGLESGGEPSPEFC
jgi:hypothetical protein